MYGTEKTPSWTKGAARSRSQCRLATQAYKTKRKTPDAKCRAHVVKFQCPHCCHELEQSIGRLKSDEHMHCPSCGVGINFDTNRLANAADEVHKAIEKVPRETTIKFFR
jgi:transcription elongation factor Elf1